MANQGRGWSPRSGGTAGDDPGDRAHGGWMRERFWGEGGYRKITLTCLAPDLVLEDLGDLCARCRPVEVGTGHVLGIYCIRLTDQLMSQVDQVESRDTESYAVG